MNDVFDLDESEDTAEQAGAHHVSQMETVDASSTHKRRCWWMPYAALACVLAAGGAGIYAAHVSSQRHQDDLARQAYALADVVTKKAGPGLDAVFDFSSDAKSGSLKLTSPTTFYVACADGHAIIGPFKHSCDGKLAVYGPYGTSGTVIQLSLPGSPWALVARPRDQGLVPTAPTPQPSAYR